MKKKKIKYQYKNTNQSLVKTLFAGLVLIISFAILPNFIKFIDKSFKTNEIVINSSKQNFDEVFDKQKKDNTSHPGPV